MLNFKTIKLYGDLGKKFGREFKFDVASSAEAIRLLVANFKDFATYFVGDGTKKYYVTVGGQSLKLEETTYPVSSKEIIKIIPVIEGATDDPFVNILIGGALILATSGVVGTEIAFAGITYGTVASIGWGLVIGGVSSLLFAPPTPDGTLEAAENAPSYNFDGPVNTIRQGNPVPVGYGRLRVGSQVISAGLYSEKVAN